MDNRDTLLWTYKPPLPRTSKPGEVLWRLANRQHELRCELRDRHEFGCEAQLLYDGELHLGRRFDMRRQAVRWAELEGEASQREGWQPIENP